MNRRAVLAALVALLPASLARGHGGGLDSKGGHYNRKTGEYHYHREASTPAPARSPAPAPSRSLSLSAPPPAPASSVTFASLPAYRRVDALASALIRKGVISRADLEFAAKSLDR